VSSTQRPFQATSALLLVGVQLLAAVGVLLLGAAVSDGESVGVVFLGATPVLAPLIAVYVGLVRYAPEEGTAAALRLERPDAGAMKLILLPLLFGAAMSPVLLYLQELLGRLLPAEALDPEVENGIRAELEQTTTMLFITLSHTILVPLAHEALVRGLIQPRLMVAHGARRGLWITVFLYAAAQMSPPLLPLALLVGLPLGIIALAAGTTWASIAAHVAMVAVSLVIVEVVGSATRLPWWMVLACAAAAAGLLATIWRARRRAASGDSTTT